MSQYLAATAFKTKDYESLISLDIDCEVYSLNTDIIASRKNNENKADLEGSRYLYPEKYGWTFVSWGTIDGDIIDDCTKISRSISKILKIQVSNVRICQSSYWTHHFFNDGKLIDQYCSIPHNLFGEDEEQLELNELIEMYKGSADKLAEICEIKVDSIDRYYQHIIDFEKNYGKAYPDDECHVGEEWAFLDLWKKLGIEYPEDVESYLYEIDVSYYEK